MRLQDWCDYIDYDYSIGGCENCKLKQACECQLHCNYQVFSTLLNLPNQAAIKAEMDRMLAYRSDPRLAGKYFWSMSCDGRGLYKRTKP